MRRAWIVAALLPLVASCSDDDEAPTAVTQEAYNAEATRLCGQHGDVIEDAYVETSPDSDAEEAAFYTEELVPRVRAFIRRLNDHGFPPDRQEAYATALNEALAVLGELEADPFTYIDERHRAENPPEEDLLVRLRAALDNADVPC